MAMALAAKREFDPAGLSARLAAYGGEGSADRQEIEGDALPAAVLALIVDHPVPTLLMTLRAADLAAHAGQISFPGGRIEPGEDPVTAALREAEEEVGLDPARVRILGRLPAYHTVTGFLVHPVVGLARPPLTLRPDPAEVAEAFELPLAPFLVAGGLRRESRNFGSRRAEFWAIEVEGRYIWGATAAILNMLRDVMK